MTSFNPLHFQVIVASVLYGALGIAMLVFGFWLVDKIIPFDIWGAIKGHGTAQDGLEPQGNAALAIVVTGFLISVGLIIAAVVH